MEKDFKEFCSRVRELRVGVPAGRAFPEGVKTEILEWAERKHPDDVVKGAGVARVTINRWRRERAHLKASKKTTVATATAAPQENIFHVTRVSVQAQEKQKEQTLRVLARLCLGNASIEFLDAETLVCVLERRCL